MSRPGIEAIVVSTYEAIENRRTIVTCVVGVEYEENGERKVLLAADSAATNDYTTQVVRGPKVFRVGDLLIGFTTSFRMGQLLQYRLPHCLPKKAHEHLDPMEHIITNVIPAIIYALDDGRYIKDQNQRIEAGTYLIGCSGRLFEVSDGFGVCEWQDGYGAIGSGYQPALGAMFATYPPVTAKATFGQATKMAYEGLSAAVQFSGSCSRPFSIIASDFANTTHLSGHRVQLDFVEPWTNASPLKKAE